MKKNHLFHTAAALWLALSLTIAVKPAQAQSGLSMTCRLLPLTCPAKTTNDSRWSKPAPDQGIEVINDGAHTLSIAYGWYEAAKSAQPIGDFTLPVVLSDYWAAQGWIEVEPNSSYTLYPSAANLEAYIRIEADGKVISPPGSAAIRDFCVSAHNFVSKAQIGTEWYVLEDEQGSADSGENCSDAGGEWHTFYRMERMTSFVVN
jgi:hypothetical protein